MCTYLTIKVLFVFVYICIAPGSICFGPGNIVSGTGKTGCFGRCQNINPVSHPDLRKMERGSILTRVDFYIAIPPVARSFSRLHTVIVTHQQWSTVSNNINENKQRENNSSISKLQLDNWRPWLISKKKRNETTRRRYNNTNNNDGSNYRDNISCSLGGGNNE